ncbi:dTDP-4-dehydrorhamnose reductase [Sphingomonas sp. dw_22]|uniref:dTDP-4-dehydrorhamnose reductase n=1 Tax=Sphingomonas sp. dw_22 TaxID=2721175 RepID=UPI001BD23EEB|nr:dTDP-4-dehydrorhamnose reductase [Sphingomonas sp. dw_22]
MRILVTGREGQVAQSLAEQAGGHELVFAARPDLDLAIPATIEAVVARVHPDLIVSAAAYTAVDKAESEPDLAMAINGEAPGVLARAGAKIGAPILYLSTDYVFDGSLDRPWREDDPVGPISAYGATKLAGEQAVQASGAPHAILRLAWVYSPFGNNFVKTMLRLAETRDALNVVEDQRGCPSSALDIATAILKIADAWARDGASSGVYHFAGTGETDWAGFARAIFAESARHGGPTAQVTGIPSSDYPTPARRPANSRLDCTRFAETFGYRAPAWQDSLAVVVERLLD